MTIGGNTITRIAQANGFTAPHNNFVAARSQGTLLCEWSSSPPHPEKFYKGKSHHI
jgi:hypothetical protein